MISLVLGGARSGKSRYGELLVTQTSHARENSAIQYRVTYVATATADDDEMAHRILRHQADRPEHWHLIEEPLHIANIISNAKSHDILLIDCMTLYLTNWLCRETGAIADWHEEKTAFLTALKSTTAHIVIVSNEVGSGIVPLGELSRLFVDEAGWLNQALATIAHDVALVVAGCPLALKGEAI